MYTTGERERRFRVITRKVPVAINIDQWLRSLNVGLISVLVAQQAFRVVEKSHQMSQGPQLVLEFAKLFFDFLQRVLPSSVRSLTSDAGVGKNP